MFVRAQSHVFLVLSTDEWNLLCRVSYSGAAFIAFVNPEEFYAGVT